MNARRRQELQRKISAFPGRITEKSVLALLTDVEQRQFQSTVSDVKGAPINNRVYLFLGGKKGKCEICRKATSWDCHDGGFYKRFCSQKCLGANRIETKKRLQNVSTVTERLSKSQMRTFLKCIKAVDSKAPAGKCAHERTLLLELERQAPHLVQVFSGLPSRYFGVKKQMAVGQLPIRKCLTCKEVIWVTSQIGEQEHCSSKCAGKNPRTHVRARKTFMKTLGVTNPRKLESVKKKAQKTSMKRYGTKFPMQNAAFQSKVLGSRYKAKQVMLGDRSVKVLGYEGKAIEWMLSKGVRPASLKVALEGEVPQIRYKDPKTEKIRIYTPDFYLENKNRLIEVKSTYTLFGSEEIFNNNKAKAKAAMRAGFDFVLLLMDSKGNRLKVPRNWYKMSRAIVMKAAA